MNNNEIIFNLIDHALKEEVFKFKSEDELKLTQKIFENGLVGLLYNSIDTDSFILPKYNQMLKHAFGSFVAKDTQQQLIIETLKDIFNENKIPHIFLKGSHLKSLYPKSYMRGMGDIDILVPLELFEKAKKVLLNANFKFKSATSHHHVYESDDLNQIELHQSITSSNEYENENFLKEIWNHARIDIEYTYKIEPAYEYVYLLTHLIRHIRTSGVGIRSILDIDIFYNAYEEWINKEKLDKYLKDENLYDFHLKVIHLNNIFTNKIKPTVEDELIIDYIMDSGIHGLGQKHDQYLTKRTHEQTRLKKSKFRFFLNEVFPSKERIKESYPYLKKHPYLLSWAWFVRILKQVFKVKNTKNRLKSISNDSEVNSVKSVYDYLGI
ncbi:nucleotidyltransferase domain-containing protein [Acholeplasma granularum]|uniref:nucleotidyltransferase domain-containing protein n=1 Tax=Acholeplasma granularum TaxID=264635 RepID=UPI0004711BD2|nr:nucleotidyltransferase family protein [Acholeplasma granularum]